MKEAEKINCRRFINARIVTQGNHRLNLAFLAHLFITYPALPPQSLFTSTPDKKDVNEEKSTLLAANIVDCMYLCLYVSIAYCRWLNAIGVTSYVHNLHHDLSDGIALIEVSNV